MESELIEAGVPPVLAGGVAGRGRLNRASLFLMMFSESDKEPEKELLRMAVALELLHKSSVIRDDIEDEDILRRGSPTESAQLGVPTALALSDVLLMVGLKSLQELAPQAMPIVIECLVKMSVGQLYDLHGLPKALRGDAFVISELKTGSLISLVFWMGAARAGRPVDDCRRLEMAGLHLGVAFQLANDINNVTKDEGRGKEMGADLICKRSSSVALILKQSGDAELAVPEAVTDAVAQVQGEVVRRLELARRVSQDLSIPLPDVLRRILMDDSMAEAFVSDQQFTDL